MRVLDGSRPYSGDSIATFVPAILRDRQDSLATLLREPQASRQGTPFIPRVATRAHHQPVN